VPEVGREEARVIACVYSASSCQALVERVLSAPLGFTG